MTVHITANIGRHGNSHRAIAAVRRSVPRRGSTWVGWQELDGGDAPDEHAAVEDLFPDREGWRHTGWETQVAVTDNGGDLWVPVRAWIVKGHPPIDRISPWRPIVFRLYRHRRTGRLLAVWNTHTVADAYTGRARTAVELRRRYWNMLWDTLAAEVAELHAQGIDSVGTADLNRNPLPGKLHPDAVVVAHRNLDYVIAVPAPGHRVRRGPVRKITLGIDGHKALRVRVWFTGKGRLTILPPRAPAVERG